jgi:hypothetical protein
MKPTFYQGKALPFSSLDPDAFEKFVSACLVVLAPSHGFGFKSITGQPRDRGFDATGRRTNDNALVCIQCKRNSSEPFALSDLSTELAKVAMTSHSESSVVKEHWFICSGSVASVVHSALRSNNRRSLVDGAKEAAKKLKKGTSTQDGVTEAYVLGLDQIRVWSGDDLDREIGAKSSELAVTVDKYFQVHHVLREHPRPDFDETEYLARLESVSGSPAMLFVVPANPAHQVRDKSASEPPALASKDEQGTTNPKGAVGALLETQLGVVVMVSGDGGAGKTTLLKTVAWNMARARRGDATKPLPIVVELSGYTGDLQKLIHQSLAINFGVYSSVPGTFMLLLDGLNEVAPAHVNALNHELDRLDWNRCGVIATTRSDGLRKPVVLTRLTRSLQILSPNKDAIRVIVHGVFLPGQQVNAFISALSPYTLSTRLFVLPYGILMAAVAFRETGAIPNTPVELISSYAKMRWARSEEISDQTNQTYESCLQLARLVAFKMMVTKGVRQISEGDVLAVLGEALHVSIHGTEAAKAMQALIDGELLRRRSDGMLAAPHDVIVAWLVAESLSTTWNSHTGSLATKVADDAWVFAAPKISVEDQIGYLDAVEAADVVLAAKCALNMRAEAKSHLEQLAKVQLSRGGLRQRRGAMALGIIGTEAAIAILEANQQIKNLEYDVTDALMMAGHAPTLEKYLDSAESFPMSRGQSWLRLRGAHTLPVARKRIDSMAHGDEVAVSVETIAEYGDVTDVPRLVKVLDAHPGLSLWIPAVQALAAFDPEDAHRRSATRWEEASDETRASLWPYIEPTTDKATEWAFRILSAERLVLEVAEDDSQVRGSAVELVKRSTLTTEMRDRFCEAFATRTEANARGLWRVMIANPNKVVDNIALRIDPSQNEFGWACVYARSSDWGDETHMAFSNRANKLSPPTLMSWSGSCFIDYLISRSELHQAAQLLIGAVGQLKVEHIHSGWTPIYKAAAVVEHLPKEVIEDLLLKYVSFRASLGDGNQAARLIARLSSSELEGLLDRAKNFRSRAILLSAMVEVTPTKAIRDVFLSVMAEAMTEPHPAALDALQRPIRAWWADDVLSSVVDVLIDIDTNDELNATQRFGALANTVCNLITHEQFERLVQPRISDNLSPFLTEIFKFWLDVTQLRPNS